MGAEGLEQHDQIPQKTHNSIPRGAESDALPALSGISDPELQHVVKGWDELPDAGRAGILAMVAALKPQDKA